MTGSVDTDLAALRAVRDVQRRNQRRWRLLRGPLSAAAGATTGVGIVQFGYGILDALLVAAAALAGTWIWVGVWVDRAAADAEIFAQLCREQSEAGVAPQ